MSDLFGKKPNELTLIINNKEIVVLDATFKKTLDTAADALTVTMPWTPGLDPDLDAATAPYSYGDAQVYLGGTLVSKMTLYDVEQITGKGGTTKTLDLFSKTADIIDSTVCPPYEEFNVKLSDRAKHQCAKFNINVIIGEEAAKSINITQAVIQTTGYKKVRILNGHYDPSQGAYGNYKIAYQPIKKTSYVPVEFKFPKVKAEPVDTVFYHLNKLASQRGLLLSNTLEGDLLITAANVNAKSIGTIQEINGSGISDEYRAHFKGRDRFNIYRALVRAPHHKKTSYIQTVQDTVVKSPRLLCFHADDNIAGSIKDSALFRKNKSAADAMTLSFPVNSWYGPDGNLWTCNTAVTIISPTLSTKNGFTYLIKSVDFKYSASGATAILGLVPPQCYSTDAKLNEPWMNE